MSITDDLREYALGWDERNRVRRDLTAIADRIDAEHESAVRERRRSCVYYDPERHYCSCHDFDVSGYVELPKDADGEYIHIGDVMEWCDSGDTLEVIGIGDDTLFYIDPEGDRTYAEWTSARNKRHYHAPTVEDVLTEFGIDWEHESDCEDRAALLKEYAAKLRLAEGDA